MNIITHSAASAAILAHVEAGTLVQGDWHKRGADGREFACLLGSIHPSVTSPEQCNGDLMPMWLAQLTPTLFDGLPADTVRPIARRYGELVARWHVLTAADWDMILRNFLVRVIDDAVDAARPCCEKTTYWQQVADACEQSKAAIASGGKAASAAAWAAASDAGAAAWAGASAAANGAVNDAASAAAWAAASDAGAAAWAGASAAANGAVNDAVSDAGVAARAAASAAAWAAASAAASDAGAAASDAGAAAHHKLFTFLLDQIEASLFPMGRFVGSARAHHLSP